MGKTLSEILNSIPGVKKAYFEPPTNIQLKYPCIIYSLQGHDDDFADNIRYRRSKMYKVSILDENPDSEIPEALEDSLPYCDMISSPYVVNGIHHFVYQVNFSGKRYQKEVI